MSSMTWEGAIPYFSRDELACKCCGVVALDLRFAAAAPALRLACGHALTPTSVCRCAAHNEAERGHPRSLHLIANPVHPSQGSMAMDIAWAQWDPAKRLAFCRTAWGLGWSVRLANSFVHADRRVDIGLAQHAGTYDGYNGTFTTDAFARG